MKSFSGSRRIEKKPEKILSSKNPFAFLSKNKYGTKNFSSSVSVCDSVDQLMKEKYGILDNFEENQEQLEIIVLGNEQEDNFFNDKSPRGVAELSMPIETRMISMKCKEISRIESDDDLHYCDVGNTNLDASKGEILLKSMDESNMITKIEKLMGSNDSTMLCNTTATNSQLSSECENFIVKKYDDEEEEDLRSCAVSSCTMASFDEDIENRKQAREIVNSAANARSCKKTSDNEVNEEYNFLSTQELIDKRNEKARELLSHGFTKEVIDIYKETILLCKKDLQRIKNVKLQKHIKSRKSHEIHTPYYYSQTFDDDGNSINDSDFLLNATNYVSPQTKILKNRFFDFQYESLSIGVAHVLNNLGVVYEMTEKYDDALRSCRESLKIYRSLSNSKDDTDQEKNLQRNIARTISNIAQILRAKESLSSRKKIEEDVEGLLAKFDLLEDGTNSELEKSFLLNEALQLHKQLFKIQCTSLGLAHPNIAKTLHDMGKLRWKLVQHETRHFRSDDTIRSRERNQRKALNDIIQAKDILIAAYNDNNQLKHPSFISIFLDLAKIYHGIDIESSHIATNTSKQSMLHKEALQYYNLALKLQKQLNAEKIINYKISLTLAHMGDVYNNYGDSSMAVKSYHECIELLSELDQNSYEFEILYHLYEKLGSLYFYQMKDCNNAKKCYYNGLQILLRNSSSILDLKSSPNTKQSENKLAFPTETLQKPAYSNTLVATALLNLGMVYISSGKYSKALLCFQEKLKIHNKEENDPRKFFHISETLTNIGNVYIYDSQWREALDTFRNLVKCARRWSSSNPQYQFLIAKYLERIGFVHIQLENEEEAKICFDEALRILREEKNTKKDSNLSNEIEALTDCIIKKQMSFNVNQKVQGQVRSSTSHRTTEYEKKAFVFIEESDYKNALKILMKGLEKFRSKKQEDSTCSPNITIDIARIMCHIAQIFDKYQKDVSSAKIFYTEALRLYKDDLSLEESDIRIKRIRCRLKKLNECIEI